MLCSRSVPLFRLLEFDFGMYSKVSVFNLIFPCCDSPGTHVLVIPGPVLRKSKIRTNSEVSAMKGKHRGGGNRK